MFIAILRSIVQKKTEGAMITKYDGSHICICYFPVLNANFGQTFFFKHSAVATKKRGLLSCTMILLY